MAAMLPLRYSVATYHLILLELPRCITITARDKLYTADISQRFYCELRVCILLRDRAVNVVPFVGVYSTQAHPFALVYEYMDGLNLNQHLLNEPNAKKLELVLIPLHALSIGDIGPLTLLDDS